MFRCFRAAFLIILCTLIGCGHRYYAVKYLFYRKNTYLPDEQGNLRKAQLDKLLNANTITFAPGSQCNDVTIGEERRVSSLDLITTDCGALMSELEAAAQAAGFTVISWKSIKQPLHQHASEQGVDMIIDVNRLSIDVQMADSVTVGEVQFYEDNEDAKLTRLDISNKRQVADLCIEKRAPVLKSSSRPIGVLDVKVSDAKQGALLTREVVVFPEGSTAVASEKQFYDGSSSQAPDEVICRNDPSDEPDWHKTPEPKPRQEGVDKGSSVTYVGNSKVPRDEQVRILRGTAQKFIERLTLLRAAHSRQSDWEKLPWPSSTAGATVAAQTAKKATKDPASDKGKTTKLKHSKAERENLEKGDKDYDGSGYITNIIKELSSLLEEGTDIQHTKEKLARAKDLYTNSKNDWVAGYFYGLIVRRYPIDEIGCKQTVQPLLETALGKCSDPTLKRTMGDSQRRQCDKVIISNAASMIKDCPPGILDKNN